MITVTLWNTKAPKVSGEPNRIDGGYVVAVKARIPGSGPLRAVTCKHCRTEWGADGWMADRLVGLSVCPNCGGLLGPCDPSVHVERLPMDARVQVREWEPRRGHAVLVIPEGAAVAIAGKHTVAYVVARPEGVDVIDGRCNVDDLDVPYCPRATVTDGS